MYDRPTSLAAYESIFGTRDSTRRQLFAYLKRYGSHTCEELETRFNLKHQTASARLSELAKAGLIYDSGRTFPTSSGRAAILWKAKIA